MPPLLLKQTLQVFKLTVSKLSLDAIITMFAEHKASDLFLTVGFPPTMRVDSRWFCTDDDMLDDADMNMLVNALLNEDQIDEFDSTMELNLVKNWNDIARLRINVFKQLQHTAFAIRRIETHIPELDSLSLPAIYKDLIMQKRGLIIVVGQTGSGKSTTLASMIGYRNQNGQGHIITIEDPIEFVHQHRNCIISQRDVGIDTYSYGMALKNALRQTPDVILIGEIRDRETMEHAISFAETGHLCVSTLHSNNANQAIERILNFFPSDMHPQVLANLSFNLRAIVSQRLVDNILEKRSPAIEILLNEGIIRDYIHRGDVHMIKEVMEKNVDIGMQTFDQSLIKLYEDEIITHETAIREADSPSNMRMRLQQRDVEHKFAQSPKHMIAGKAPITKENF